jgi:hypothetical protein
MTVAKSVSVLVAGITRVLVVLAVTSTVLVTDTGIMVVSVTKAVAVLKMLRVEDVYTTSVSTMISVVVVVVVYGTVVIEVDRTVSNKVDADV